MKSSRAAQRGTVTAGDLVTELQAVAPCVVVCVLDDQGFPHEIVRVHYRMDLDMVAIESGAPICKRDPKPRRWPPF